MNQPQVSNYPTPGQIEALVLEHYGLAGSLQALVGEVDLNYQLSTVRGDYLLKISRPGADRTQLEFLNDLHAYLSTRLPAAETPQVIPTLLGSSMVDFELNPDQTCIARLYSWLPGRLWSSVRPHPSKLLVELGAKAGAISTALAAFDHAAAHRDMQWDIAQAAWTEGMLNHFSGEQRQVLDFFQNEFQNIQPEYLQLRKQVVHNDVNDNNVLVDFVDDQPTVSGIIDFGDAIFTQLINDLAITIAYGIMGQDDIGHAAGQIVTGYHQQCPMTREEINLLYPLIAMRLVISVCKAAENRRLEPENAYLQISETHAWTVLEQLRSLDSEAFTYGLLDACGFLADTQSRAAAAIEKCSLLALFPQGMFKAIQVLDLGLESRLMTPNVLAGDHTVFDASIQKMKDDASETLFAGRHLEIRPAYGKKIDERIGPKGRECRAVHLGLDLWVDPETAVLAPRSCRILEINRSDENSSLLLDLQSAASVYLLISGLEPASLGVDVGDMIETGTFLGNVGQKEPGESFGGPLNLQILKHPFQVIKNIPTRIYPSERALWKRLTWMPHQLFQELDIPVEKHHTLFDLVNTRRKHLGKSLSISYEAPLYMLRGMGVYLIDAEGQRYLDTVNNVAHVGHEHPRVVAAGQRQMGLLNTNTRYVHHKITELAAALLETFPEPLTVVHFVNSGSEANELALRMARAATGQKDIIAVERGYHGNTQACIDISSYKFDGKGGQGCPEHTHIVPLPDAFRGRYQGPECGDRYAEHVLEQIAKIQDLGGEPAAFICESIISCGGQIELPQGYLNRAFESVRQAGGVCISDEVQVGCGRVGSHFWGFQIHDVVPDIVTIGKPLGNGHPLAAVICTGDVAEAFANGMEYFNTFGGNPVSCAIGLEVLDVIREENLQQHALEVGNYLKKGLQELQTKHSIIADIRGQGLFLGFELTDAEKKPLTRKAGYLANRMRDLGVLKSSDVKDNNVLKIKPPMVFSRENADALLMRLDQVCSETLMQDD
jgi:4-aminobutyrate aminotransferase-like enzyme/Ser/Thr protein kinase RdoA (MazF antagonist)